MQLKSLLLTLDQLMLSLKQFFKKQVKEDSQSRRGEAQILATHFGLGNAEFEAIFLKTSTHLEKANGGEKETKIYVVMMRNYLSFLVCTEAEVEPHPNLTLFT